MAMSPKGRFFVTRDSFFHNIQLWSLPDGKLLNTFSIDGGYKRDGNMCLSPDGRILIIACQHNIQLWSVPECKLLKTLDKSWDFQGLSVSPDGKILVAGRNNSVSLWSLPDGQLIDEIYGGGSHNRRIAISPDSSFLVIPKYWDSGYSDYPINLWSLGTRHYINIPVNNTTLQDLELVQTSLQDSKLTNSEQNWLQFLLALMRWHKRFEIEVANAPQKIDAGEFEIEIEG